MVGFRGSTAAINRAGGAGFRHDDFHQEGKFGLQFSPNPDCDVFAGGIFEAGNFVEVVVVQLFPNRLEGGGDVRVIHEPAVFGIAFTRDDDFDFEAVAVEPAAFVGPGQTRQQMRGFKLKGFTQFDFHKVDFAWRLMPQSRSMPPNRPGAGVRHGAR